MRNQGISGLLLVVGAMASLGCLSEDIPESEPYCGYNKHYDDELEECVSDDDDDGYGGSAGYGGGGSGGSLNPNQGTKLANYPHYYQVQTYWCWAATITQMANYYGNPVKGCQLASVNARAPFIDYCCHPAYGTDPACNQPAETWEMDVIMEQIGFDSRINGVVSEGLLVAELQERRPVFIGFSNSFAGHVMTIDAFEPTPSGNVYWVFDSAYNSYQPVLYNDLRFYQSSGGLLEWSLTFTGLKRF